MEHLKDIYESRMKSYQSIDMLNRGFLINLDDEKTNNNPTGQFEPALQQNPVGFQDIEWQRDQTDFDGYDETELFDFRE